MAKKSAGQRRFERFKRLSQGYAEAIDYAVFCELRRLKGRPEWSAEDEAVLELAVNRGAGPALEDLYAEHPRWRALVAARGWRLEPEPLSADEMNRIMIVTIRRMSYRWTSSDMAQFVRYFLADIEVNGAPPPQEPFPSETELPATVADLLCCRLPQDLWLHLFSSMYLAAGPAGRALVKSRLIQAATSKFIAKCIDMDHTDMAACQ